MATGWRSCGVQFDEPGRVAVILDATGVARLGEFGGVARDQLVLHELTPQRASLEDMFVELTGELTTAGSTS